MKYIFLFSISLFFIFINQNNIQAQDATFAQFHRNKLHLNPAFAGFERGLVFSSIYRTQWIPVGGEVAKFKTQSASLGYELRALQSGVGVLYTENTEGIGLKNNNFGILYAFRTKFSKKYELSLGLKISRSWRSLNWENLRFSDQFHPIDGLINSQSRILPQDLLARQKNYNYDIGFVIDRDLAESTNKILRGSAFRFGMALNHLFRPEVSLIGANDRLGTRISLHSTWIKNLGGSSSSKNLITFVKIDRQKGSSADTFWFQQIDLGFILSRGRATTVFAGAFWHATKPIKNSIASIFKPSGEKPKLNSTNAFTLLLGSKIPFKKGDEKSPSFSVAISYSHDYSGLVSSSGGIKEISLKININRDNAKNCKPNLRAGTSLSPF